MAYHIQWLHTVVNNSIQSIIILVTVTNTSLYVITSSRDGGFLFSLYAKIPEPFQLYLMDSNSKISVKINVSFCLKSFLEYLDI